MSTPPEAHLRNLLAQAEEDLREAEQRRDHQALVVSGLLADTEARATAERVLHEINRTIAFIRANRDLLDLILD